MNLSDTDLTGANLTEADLTRVVLSSANLTAADLSEANLRQTILSGAKVEGANFSGADLSEANLAGANLKKADLSDTDLSKADLSGVRLEATHLSGADLSEVNLPGISLRGIDTRVGWFHVATLHQVNLSGADLSEAILTGMNLSGANLSGANLTEAVLVGANLTGANLCGADLYRCHFDIDTQLAQIRLDANTRLADVIWNDVSLTRVNWETLPILGDETTARRPKSNGGVIKDREWRLAEFIAAARAYRQLAVALRTQGMNDDADRYAYRAQLMQRIVLRLRRRWGAALGSWLLDLIAGYGYRPMRSLFTYGLVVLAFAVGYYFMRENVHPALNPVDAIIFSITSFHGRGFMPGENVNLHNPLTVAAAIEAIIGLLIEITFIATFTQRFFAR